MSVSPVDGPSCLGPCMKMTCALGVVCCLRPVRPRPETVPAREDFNGDKLSTARTESSAWPPRSRQRPPRQRVPRVPRTRETKRSRAQPGSPPPQQQQQRAPGPPGCGPGGAAPRQEVSSYQSAKGGEGEIREFSESFAGRRAGLQVGLPYACEDDSLQWGHESADSHHDWQ